MKRHHIFWLAALLLMPACLSVHAAKFDVTAKGKTMEVAESNAKVIAVRKCMQALISAEVIRDKREAIRQKIILQSPLYVRGLEAKNSFEQNAFLTLEAVVDVDTQALTDALASLGMDEATLTRMNTVAASLEPRAAADSEAQAEPQPAAAPVGEAPVAEIPSTTSAGAADPAQATASPTQSSTPVEVPESTESSTVSPQEEPPLPATETPEPVLPEQNPATADSTDETTNAVAPSGAPSTAEADSATPADISTHIYMNLQALKAFIPLRLIEIITNDDEKKQLLNAFKSTKIQTVYATVQQEKLKALVAELPEGDKPGELLKPGMTRKEFLGLLTNADVSALSASQNSSLKELKATSDPGILEMNGTYIGFAASSLIMSENLAEVQTVRALLSEGKPLFAADKNEALWIRIRQDARDAVVSGRPAARGWLFNAVCNLGTIPELENVGPLNVVGLTPNAPAVFVLAGKFGEHVTALLKSLNKDDALNTPIPAHKLDSAVVGIFRGGSLPSFAVGVKAASDVIPVMTTLTQGLLPWQKTTVQDWQIAYTCDLGPLVGVPMNAVMVSRDDTLLYGSMDPTTLQGPKTDLVTRISTSPDLEGVPFPENISNLLFLDVPGLWKEAHTLLADDSPLAGHLQMFLNAPLKEGLQKLFAASPPLKTATLWLESPQMTRGGLYIALSEENTDAFYEALSELMKLQEVQKIEQAVNPLK